jgi:hypothetical protein
MAEIIVGSEAINRATYKGVGDTVVNQSVTANGAGIIHTVELYLYTGGNFKVGIFYVSGSNRLTTRSTADLGSLPDGKSTITGLSLAVETGDMIGIYTSGGRIDSGNDYGGIWIQPGELVPCNNALFSSQGAPTISLKGIGTTTPAAPAAAARTFTRPAMWGRF